MGYQQIRSI